MNLSEIKGISGVSITPEMLEKAIYNAGDPVSLANVLQKAIRGKEIIIAGFGGSITEGVGMNDNPPPESNIECTLSPECYFDRVCDWWEDTFSCKVKRVNAGIAATDTVFGIHRMETDVLQFKPDLVILEWCCNDGSEYLYKQATYENMVRKFINSGVAVILLSMSIRNGTSSQALHEPVADYYDIPMISYRDAYFENEKYPFFTTDGVHPNKVGCALAALIINNYVNKIYKSLNSIEKTVPTMPLNPLFEETLCYNNTYVADLKDVYEGKYEGIKIADLGAFTMDSQNTSFAYRSYYGFSAYSSCGKEPMIIEIDRCKTLFLLLYRNTNFRGVDFMVEINGRELTSETFTSQHGNDNSQTEWDYHWATERICNHSDGETVTLKIYPQVTSETQCVKLFSLLVSQKESM